LEAGKVKVKRLISTGFDPFSLENSRISPFLPVFLEAKEAMIAWDPANIP
jgi:hypothetical protein